ncbi:hypothetical protein NHX12_022425 [Muraenolepis orangiensis]|uniref:MAD2L1-binding protein n=1 Tax=Muraenolepis orangiensis TaxID=630683 RepID=A0A9Q0IR98_9TELE|nr:hypothetical protein NHX12_017299 [Muraenolepis orangiensis]KAJ3610332.1 hypothetical protein NHX12_022425 [Muraenolepis orangiensis]
MMAEESIIALPKRVVLQDIHREHSVTTSSDDDGGCSLLQQKKDDDDERYPTEPTCINSKVIISEQCRRPSPASHTEGRQQQPSFTPDIMMTTTTTQCLTRTTNTGEEGGGDDATDKENTDLVSPPSGVAAGSSEDDAVEEEDSSSCHDSTPESTGPTDAEIVRRAQEEGRVEVLLPGTVTQQGCCCFVSEILKCVLYQRQQLPMTYDQLLYYQKNDLVSIQSKELVSWRPAQPTDTDRRKRHRTLDELEEVFHHLELLFSLSLVPRVLLLLGGSLVLPKEMYEINMEALVLAAGDGSLRVSSCLRQLFRTLFVADILSDVRSIRLMATTVLVLAHRDCGVGWFRPKLDFKVPVRVKRQIIALSTDTDIGGSPQSDASNWEDYVWFQAPVAIKGFSK